MLTVIQGDLDDLRQRFYNSPWTLSEQDFDLVLEAEHLDPAEGFDLIIWRLQNLSLPDELEKRLLLAAVIGTKDEFQRLKSLIDRRNKLGLKSISCNTLGNSKD